MSKKSELLKILLFFIFLIMSLNQLAIITNTLIHVYLLVFIILLYLLSKTNIFNFSDAFKFSKKDIKITFILCIIISILQFFSFKFIYPKFYSSQNFILNNILIILILGQLLNCIIEEIFFRGYIFSLLNTKFTDKVYIFVSSIIFTIYHIIIFDLSSINEGIMLSIFTFSSGVCLGYIYIKTYNLLPCILIHTVYNISQNIISLEFNAINLDIQNIYIQFGYSSLIFIITLLIYIRYDNRRLSKHFFPND